MASTPSLGPAFEPELAEVTRYAIVSWPGRAKSHRSHEVCDYADGSWHRIGLTNMRFGEYHE